MWFVKTAIILLNTLPLSFRLILGEMVGYLFYLISFRKRFTAFRNVKMVFPEKEGGQIKRIVKGSFINFGRVVMETLSLSRGDFKFVKECVDFSSWEQIKGKQAQIVVGIHEGSWELINCSAALRTKYAIFVREQKRKNLDKMLNDVRRKYGLKVCFSLKELITFLKQNYWVGLVMDHGAEENAQRVEFFGHKVPTPGGAVFLARKYNKVIYPCFSHRIGRARHKLEVGRKILPDEENVLRQINSVFENFIKKYPHEYMWWYKRFKRKETLDILVLSDGKPGHFKQSQAFIEIMKSYGWGIRKKEVLPQYRNRFSRTILEICALTSGNWCIGCGRCLDILLKKDSARELKTLYADIIVSTGSSMAPINLLASRYQGARSVVILKPNISARKFDLLIIPEHDDIKHRDNVVRIKGALTFMNKQDISLCRDYLGQKDKRRIALFIGGVNRGAQEKVYFDNLKIFLSKLRNYVRNTGYFLLITTSRRTPRSIENYLENEVSHWDECEKLIIANRENYPFIAGGFIGLSERVFISGESISMITESLSLSKPTFAVIFDSSLSDKHRRFLSSLDKEGLITVLSFPYEGIDNSREITCGLQRINALILKKYIGRLL